MFGFQLEENAVTEKICVPVESRKEGAEGAEQEEGIRYIELPDSWSKELDDVSEQLVLGMGDARVVCLYLPDQWEKLGELLRAEHAEKDRSIRILRRFVLASAWAAEIEEGRLAVPEQLLRTAGIETEAVLKKYETGDGTYYTISAAER